MKERVLAGYQPEAFFYWFEEISRIPHGSRKEEALVQFIMNFAAQRGICAQRDEIGNVFMRLPASPGYENEPTLLLQAHLDMVWARAEGVDFDFETQPIRFRIEDNKLYGDGTNLGSDNGIGVAFMLAVADDPAMVHPPLELLFTVQEEIGLVGIQHFDMSNITARRMINTDCGYSHGMCVSSVGSIKYKIEKEFSLSAPEGCRMLHLAIRNGLGGHGGLMCHKGRACAVNVAGLLLHLLKKAMPIRMVDFTAEGGAIHPRCDAVFAVPAERVEEAIALLDTAWQKHRDRYEVSDPHMTAETAPIHSDAAALSAADSGSLIDLMMLLPTAALRHDGEDANFILTSNSIAATTLHEGRFSMTAGVRSVINSERDSAWEKLVAIMELLGFTPEVTGGYDSWPSRPASPIQKKLREAHRKLYGSEIEVEHIHGGIEVSYIMNCHPDMDAVGFSPTAKGAHSVDEHLLLDEVPVFWNLMMEFFQTKD